MVTHPRRMGAMADSGAVCLGIALAAASQRPAGQAPAVRAWQSTPRQRAVHAVPIMAELSGPPGLVVRGVVARTTTGSVSQVKVSPNHRRWFCILRPPGGAAGA